MMQAFPRHTTFFRFCKNDAVVVMLGRRTSTKGLEIGGDALAEGYSEVVLSSPGGGGRGFSIDNGESIFAVEAAPLDRSEV